MAFLLHSERMNENSKLQNFRNFKTSLHAAARVLALKVAATPRNGPTSFRVTAMDNEAIDIELTFVQHYDGDTPKLAFGNESTSLSNLSLANIKKHLIKRLAKRRADLSAQVLDDAKDAAGSKAEEAMAKHMTAFLPKSMKHIDPAKDDNAISHTWRSERGEFRLVYVHVLGTVNSFSFEYNVEYKFAAGLTRDIKLEGEFDVTNSRDMETMLSGILQLGQ